MANYLHANSDDARQNIDLLAADRDRLAARMKTPWALMVAAGAALAWFVADAASASPGTNYKAGTGYLLAVAALTVVVYLTANASGAKFRGLGAWGWVTVGVVLGWTLLMFIIGLALVSMDLRAWTMIPVALAWLGGTLGSALVFRSGVKTINRD